VDEAAVIPLVELDALILDFGGVLYPIDYDAPVRAFEALGFADFAAFYHQATQHPWFDDLEVGAMTEGAFLAALQSRCRVGTTSEDVRKAWNSILLRMPPERLPELEALSETTRLFLFSNTNALHALEFEHRLAEDGLLAPFQSCFQAVHYSHELGLRKPHPESFSALCTRHGLTPSRTGFVDDSQHHVEGARAAGLHGLHFHPDAGTSLPAAIAAAGWRFN
jgi:putative hydrolase of the HAD superfamily